MDRQNKNEIKVNALQNVAPSKSKSSETTVSKYVLLNIILKHNIV